MILWDRTQIDKTKAATENDLDNKEELFLDAINDYLDASDEAQDAVD